MGFKNFKNDVQRDAELLKEFYSDPKKHVKKVPLIVIVMTFAYIGFFFVFLKFIQTSNYSIIETLLAEFLYIIIGYFLLLKTFEYFKKQTKEQKNEDK